MDIEKAEAALKRAADKAVHGTREERSGRFLPAKGHDATPAAGRVSKQSDVSRRKA
ncbi:MAG: hypothetical protein WD688_08880 [Candidatus Binatia bacterium]